MCQETRTWHRVALDRHLHVALCLGPLVWLGLGFWLAPSSRPVPLQTIALVVLVYPVLEELAFRGFLQSWLIETPVFKWRALPGVSVANLLTSVVFAASHMVNQPLVWAALVFPPSLVFGYFRDRYNVVWPSTMLHCWYNAGFVFFFY